MQVEVAFISTRVTIVREEMVVELIAREKELASLHAFLGKGHHGPAALVLEGEAGIGKSTLWVAGVEYARARDLRVLASRPAEVERGLAHVGLGDLFDDVLDDVLPVLSAPRRRALEAALLLEEEASGDPVDHRALAVAVRDVLQLLSREEPILVAFDDVQWLDPFSSGAVAFALRRLAASHVYLLLARRRWAERIRTSFTGACQGADATATARAFEAPRAPEGLAAVPRRGGKLGDRRSRPSSIRRDTTRSSPLS